MTLEEKRMYVPDLIDVVPVHRRRELKIPEDKFPCCFFYGSAGREDLSAKVCFCLP